MSLWKTEIRRGRGCICPVAYTVIVTEVATGKRRHVEVFFGHDGRVVRAEAVRYAKRVHERDYLVGPCNPHLPTNFPLD